VETSRCCIRQQNLSSIAVSWLPSEERRQRKLNARQEKLLKLLAEEVANRTAAKERETNEFATCMRGQPVKRLRFVTKACALGARKIDRAVGGLGMRKAMR